MPDKTRSPILLVGAFLCAVITILLALQVWHEAFQRSAQVVETERSLLNLGRAITSDAESTLKAADIVLVDLLERLRVDGRSPDAVRRLNALLAARLTDLPCVQGLFVYDETGRWMASSLAAIPDGVNNSDREYFARHASDPSPQPFVGAPIRSRSTGAWIVTISRRVSGPGGGFAGVVLATIDVRSLTERFSTMDLGKAGAAALFSRDGRVLARRPELEAYIGKDLSRTPLFQDHIDRHGSGVGRFVSKFDNTVRLAGYISGSTFPIVGVAAVSEHEALASWRMNALVSSAVVLILGGAVVVLGLRLLAHMRRQVRIELDLSRSETLFRLLAEHSGDVVSSIDAQGIRRYVSPSATQVFGKSPEQLVGRSFLDDLDPRDAPVLLSAVGRLRRRVERIVTVTHRFTRPDDGRTIWLETSVRPAGREGTSEGVVATSRDITKRKALEDELACLARTDALTGLANRRAFDERLALAWGDSACRGNAVALALFDLDRFKAYNDLLGHQAGDDCLVRVAAALRDASPGPADLVARYGGEEIAVLLTECSPAEALASAEAMLAAVRRLLIPHPSNMPHGTVTVSGGLAIQTSSGPSHLSSDLVRAADEALYAAKAGGRARLVIADAPPGLRLAG